MCMIRAREIPTLLRIIGLGLLYVRLDRLYGIPAKCLVGRVGDVGLQLQSHIREDGLSGS